MVKEPLKKPPMACICGEYIWKIDDLWVICMMCGRVYHARVLSFYRYTFKEPSEYMIPLVEPLVEEM